MRRWLLYCCWGWLLAWAMPLQAQAQRGSAEEAVALVKRAVAHLGRVGERAALRDFNNPRGGFVERELYVFAIDADAVTVANSVNRELVGKKSWNLRDADGRYLVREFFDVTQATGGGWVDYVWPHPHSGVHELKSAYVERAGGLIIGCGIYGRSELITVYTNVNFGPLVIAPGQGLYPELVAYLNRHAPKGRRFLLEQLPRKRLQAALENQQLRGIVVGMMPAWLQDEAQTRYLWTPAFFSDGFALVSRAEQPLSAAALAGQPQARIGVTSGYVYPGIDAWIDALGLQRDEAPSEARNLDKLALRRFDAAVVTESVLRHYLKTQPMRFVHEPLPGPRTERRLLVPRDQAAIYELVAPLVERMRMDPAWQEVVARY